jgi:hypothetical protein
VARSVEIIAWIRHTIDLSEAQLGEFTSATPLVPLEELEGTPTVTSARIERTSSVVPNSKSRVLRDTRWMMENEDALTGPVRIFLKLAAIAKTTSEPDEVRPLTQPQSNDARDFVSETLITDADPCQTAAVRHRASKRRIRHPRSVWHRQEPDHCKHRRRSSRTRRTALRLRQAHSHRCREISS